MKIAYFGFDLFFECMRQLSMQHEIMALFTWETDNEFDFNVKVTKLANDLRAPVHVGKPTPAHVEELAKNGCELVVSAGFSFKIPTLPSLRAINVHPTLLPEGRGRWPQPWLLLKYPAVAGITIHKLTDAWDAGDILAQERVKLADTDDLETLQMKLQRTAPALLTSTVTDLDALWAKAKPQGKGSTWPMPQYADRALDWKRPVRDVLRVVRAFSKMESLAEIDGAMFVVTRANGWVEPHPYTPGTLVHESNRELLVAAKDGFICLEEWKRAPT